MSLSPSPVRKNKLQGGLRGWKDRSCMDKRVSWRGLQRVDRTNKCGEDTTDWMFSNDVTARWAEFTCRLQIDFKVNQVISAGGLHVTTHIFQNTYARKNMHGSCFVGFILFFLSFFLFPFHTHTHRGRETKGDRRREMGIFLLTWYLYYADFFLKFPSYRLLFFSLHFVWSCCLRFIFQICSSGARNHFLK